MRRDFELIDNKSRASPLFCTISFHIFVDFFLIYKKDNIIFKTFKKNSKGWNFLFMKLKKFTISLWFSSHFKFNHMQKFPKDVHSQKKLLTEK
jgi:hypothetical protein